MAGKRSSSRPVEGWFENSPRSLRRRGKSGYDPSLRRFFKHNTHLMLLNWENISVKGPLIVISPQGGTPEKVYILRDSGSSLHGEYFVGYGRVDEGWTWITGEYKRGPGWKTGRSHAHGFGTLDSALEAALRTWFEPDYEGGDPLGKWGDRLTRARGRGRGQRW